MSKYKITARVTTIQAGIYVPQEPTPREVTLEVPSELIVQITKTVLPKVKQMLGKHKIITALTAIEL